MAETNAHTEVPAGGKVMFPPFQKETFPSQLFRLAITFIALYVVMARIALPQIGALTILTTVTTWNNFLWPSVVLTKSDLRPLAVGIL